MFPYFAAQNLSMVYLAGIVLVALYYGRGPSILATLLSVALFDFLFTQPYGTFAISDIQYVFTLLVMLLVAITVSSLVVRSKRQAEVVREREDLTASLYAMNRKFSSAQGVTGVVEIAVQHVSEEFDTDAQIFLPDGTGILRAIPAAKTHGAPEPEL